MPQTTRTPSGQHPSAQAVHHLDLNAEAEELLGSLPGHSRQSRNLARESGVSLVMMALEAGDIIREHAADGVVTVHLLRGHAALSSGGQSFDLQPGGLVMFQPGVRHDVRAEERSVILLMVTNGDG